MAKGNAEGEFSSEMSRPVDADESIVASLDEARERRDADIGVELTTSEGPNGEQRIEFESEDVKTVKALTAALREVSREREIGFDHQAPDPESAGFHRWRASREASKEELTTIMQEIKDRAAELKAAA